MRRGYRAFLLGTATDLPTKPFVLAKKQSSTNEMLAAVRKWGEVISNRPQ